MNDTHCRLLLCDKLSQSFVVLKKFSLAHNIVSSGTWEGLSWAVHFWAMRYLPGQNELGNPLPKCLLHSLTHLALQGSWSVCLSVSLSCSLSLFSFSLSLSSPPQASHPPGLLHVTWASLQHGSSEHIEQELHEIWVKAVRLLMT